MIDTASLLRQAEQEAEKLSALVRLVIFLTLALAIFAARGSADPGDFADIVVALYGIGAVIGLLLAWRRIFHPIVSFLFVTFDVVLVAAQVLLLTRIMGMQPASAFAVPAAAFIFVILIHASVRFRPWLVVYAAVVFALLIELAPRFMAPGPTADMSGSHLMLHGSMAGMFNLQVLPIMLLALAAFTLFMIGRRARLLLTDSVQQAARTARLARYFSPNLAARLADDDTGRALAGRRQPVAVLFVDIRGFTSLGETMAPDELSAFLSQYRKRLTEPVFRHGGTVDKFIGDAIMAVFGSPIQRDDDAARAVRCALDIIQAAAEWSSDRERAGLSSVAIGIGGHYGEVFAGAVGSEELLEYTVIGDTVNVAERLERLSREVGSNFVASAVLLKTAGQAGETVTWRRLPHQELKGHRQPVEALCLA